MACLLKRPERDQLKSWIGRKCGFTLLYKATRDGCDSTKFHALCDDKGPTVTVLYNTNDSVFGGYASQSWRENVMPVQQARLVRQGYYNEFQVPTAGYEGYRSDTNAFLFRLKRNGKSSPLKMPVTQVDYALYCQSSFGPTFGAGHDLYTFSGTINKEGKVYKLNGGCSYGNSFNNQGENANTINNGHLNVKDIEVYQVQDGAGGLCGLLEKPWRSDVEWTKKTMENLNIPEVNILLLGQVAAGKSSLFNTINSVFRGEVSARARSGTAETSLTTKFRRFRIKDTSSGSYLHFRLCDTRGLEPGEGIRSLDIGYLLDGHVPEHYQFNPSATISPTMFGFVKNPDKKDKVHAVALVIDASTFDVMPEAIITKIKDLQTGFNTRDLPQVIFLTKIDKVCPEVNDNLTCVFRSEAILDVLSKVADCFGLPRGHVYPVKNYESEIDVDDNISTLVLKALKQLLNFTDEYFEDQFE